MKAKFIIVTATSLFALSLAACDRNKHPASDNTDTTTNALDYNRNNQPATTNTGSAERSSPGHGPVPSTDADQTINAGDDTANSSISSSDNTMSNSNTQTNGNSDNTPATTQDYNSGASNTAPSSNTGATTNPNDIANPNPTSSR
jgi:hypothetical protein